MEQKFLKIEPMHDKKAFLRKIWIELANADAPLDIFKSDFSDVKIEEYHILSTSANFTANWQGDIGTYCTESYLDVETYYEEIPYIGLEEKYDLDLHGYRTVRVEKTRREERQRQVPRERTKTEWHFSSGRYSGEVESFECIDPRGTFSSERYKKDVDSKFYIRCTNEELAKSTDMIITDQMMERVSELHEKNGEMKMCASLPGDTYDEKSIRYSSNCTPICATLMRFPEYQTNIMYNGNTYQRRAFAFGGMTLMGDPIKNPLNAQVVTKKKIDNAKAYIKAKKAETDKAIKNKKDETDKAIKNKKDEVDKAIKEKRNETSEIIQDRTNEIDSKVWNKTKLVSTLSVALLLISTIVSALLRFLAPVIVLFVCAIAGLIVSKVDYKKKRDEIEKETGSKNLADEETQKEYIDKLNAECKKYIDKLNAECKEYTNTLSAKCAAECKAYMDNTILECENYEKSRKSDILAALNAKLASLGMPPASVNEYSI